MRWLMISLGCLAVAAGAGAAKVERLGQPCRAKNVLAAIVARDPATGREWFVLTNQNEASGMELLFLDTDRDKGEAVRAPAGDGSWALNEVPGGRLAVGTYFDGTFMVLDLAKKQFTKTAKFPGEDYIWNLALGKDGRLYGGTYPGGKLGALNLETYAVEDCGAPAPPNQYLRYVSPMPDGRIFCHFYTAKPTSLVFDPATRAFSPVPEELSGTTQGAVWNGYFVAGRQAFAGADLHTVSPRPFPDSPGEGPWSVNVRLTTPETLYLQQGNNLYRYRAGEKDLTLACGISLNGGAFYAARADGTLLGVRGQDYFRFRPGAASITLKPIPVASAPRPTHFLKAGPDGRLWGGPTFGQTLYHLDPKTKKYVNTSQVSNHGGEVYDVTFVGDVLYAASYAGGEIIRYDPSEPWDQWNHRNPRTIAVVGPEYIRPAGGIVKGPDGKLYSGWMARYGEYGGALAVTDPETGATERVVDPLGKQAVSALAVDSRHIYLGTTLAGNGLPNQASVDVCLGVLDTRSREVVKRFPFPGASGVAVIAVDEKASRMAVRVDLVLRILDTKSLEWVGEETARPATSRAMVAPGDGAVYYGNGKDLMRAPLDGGRPALLATLKDRIDDVTSAGEPGVLYVSAGVDVYRVRLEGKDRTR